MRLVAHGGCGRRQCGDWGRPAAETEGVLYYIIYIYMNSSRDSNVYVIIFILSLSVSQTEALSVALAYKL